MAHPTRSVWDLGAGERRCLLVVSQVLAGPECWVLYDETQRSVKIFQDYDCHPMPEDVHDRLLGAPARYGDQIVGSISDITCFSFYANKTITTGEGGMITTDSDDLAARMRIMALHARWGGEILVEHGNVEPAAIGAAFCHHMGPGNTGYPTRTIPFEPSGVSRLVRVCDVFEALTAARPYKPPLPPLHAFVIMHRMENGFDPFDASDAQGADSAADGPD